MERKYTTSEYAAFIVKARELIPDIHLGTDIIVGFPGETEEDFEQEFEFVRKMNFSNIHIFTYSPREGTPAAKMKNQVSGKIANERRRRLAKIADEMKKSFVESQLGKTLPVIFERKNKSGYFQGWSDNYINILCESAEIEKHKIIEVRAVSLIDDFSISAEIPEKSL
jgi:threonylcarbamoyladenosine tRNA methylthiotransferase MtaB